MKSKMFTCAICHGTFEKAWSDKAAEEERRELFPDSKQQDCVQVCEDCFNKLELSE